MATGIDPCTANRDSSLDPERLVDLLLERFTDKVRSQAEGEADIAGHVMKGLSDMSMVIERFNLVRKRFSELYSKWKKMKRGLPPLPEDASREQMLELQARLDTEIKELREHKEEWVAFREHLETLVSNKSVVLEAAGLIERFKQLVEVSPGTIRRKKLGVRLRRVLWIAVALGVAVVSGFVVSPIVKAILDRTLPQYGPLLTVVVVFILELIFVQPRLARAKRNMFWAHLEDLCDELGAIHNEIRGLSASLAKANADLGRLL